MLDEGAFEALHRVEVVASARGGKPQRGRGPAGGEPIPRALCVLENRAQLVLRRLRVAVEADLELRVRQLELSLFGLADIAARLEIVDRHSELGGQDAQGLDGGRSGAGLDA